MIIYTGWSMISCLNFESVYTKSVPIIIWTHTSDSQRLWIYLYRKIKKIYMKKFEENPVLKVEQRIAWSLRGRLLSLCLVACAVARSVLPWLVSEHLANSFRFLSILFISLGYFYIIFNSIHSKWHQRKLVDVKSLRYEIVIFKIQMKEKLITKW
jgi:hypothetical protein